MIEETFKAIPSLMSDYLRKLPSLVGLVSWHWPFFASTFSVVIICIFGLAMPGLLGPEAHHLRTPFGGIFGGADGVKIHQEY